MIFHFYNHYQNHYDSMLIEWAVEPFDLELNQGINGDRKAEAEANNQRALILVQDFYDEVNQSKDVFQIGYSGSASKFALVRFTAPLVSKNRALEKFWFHCNTIDIFLYSSPRGLDWNVGETIGRKYLIFGA